LRYLLSALALVALALVLSVRTGADVSRSASELPANGTASASLTARVHTAVGTPALLAAAPKLSLSFEQGAELVEASCSSLASDAPGCQLRAGFVPGRVAGTVRVEDRFGVLAESPFTLELVLDLSDGDKDGFPDASELTTEEDRTAFRRWFATVAAAQYYRLDSRWEKVHRDCAGLLRFAYKEALKTHDRDWLHGRPYLPDVSIPDVRKFRYPQVPVLGERLFRVASGAFQADKVEQSFGAAASAKWLLAENAVRIAPETAGVGDLLFFEDPDARGMGFHSMVYLADLEGIPGERDWVVYHTGPDARSEGSVRKVRLAQLLEHPDEKWRPRADNPHFLGFYRWKIVH